MKRPAGSSRAGEGTWVRSSVVAIVYAATAVLPLYLVGASAGTFQDQVGITTSQFGYAISCYFATGAVVSNRFGPLIDRIPLARALRLGMASSGAASLVLAFAADGFILLAVGLALCGAAHAFTQLGTNRILARQSSRRRALGFGLKQASIPIASLLAGFATAALSPPVDPTPLFTVAAICAGLLGVFVPRLTVSGAPGERRNAPNTDRRPLYGLALAAGLAAGSGNTLSVLVVDAFNEQGLTDQTGALVLALGSAVAVLARITTGIVVDHRRSDGRRELRAMLAAGAVCFAALGWTSGSSLPSAIAAVLAFGTGWGWPAVVFFVASTQRGIPPATGSGVILSGTMSGSVVGPLLIATVAEHFGYGLGWGLAALLLAAAALLVRPDPGAKGVTAGPARQPARDREPDE